MCFVENKNDSVFPSSKTEIPFTVKNMAEFADKRKDVESIDNLDSNQFQEFLDTSQYEMNKILR